MQTNSSCKVQKTKCRIRTHALLVACGLSLFWAACEREPDAGFRPQLMVNAMLRVGAREIYVNVNRTYRIDEPFDMWFPDAEVIVWGGGRETLQAEYVRYDLYYRSPGGHPIDPHDTWHIRVTKEGFDTVYGRTVVPGEFEILYPGNRDTVMLTDSMSWTRSRGAMGYYMSLERWQANQHYYLDVTIPNDSFDPTYDSTRVRLEEMLFLYGWSTNEVLLDLYAVDSNYYDWVGAGGFGAAAGSASASHLEGGVGVFGSACVRQLHVYYRPDTTGP